MPEKLTTEHLRLKAAKEKGEPWRLWGPYLSERQWGTVREDYSPEGTAWDYFPHEHSRSRAYRWGEDGIAGISDAEQRLCFSLALWNGQDSILKERLFGLTNSQGNHGEDVKEVYYYLDATPSHSYLRMLYKYPQQAFPYELLVAENSKRTRESAEFELLDTGVFDQDRYWDVFIEYAKGSATDILVRITAHNRGPEAATLHLLPQLWFRNTWSWKMRSHKPCIGTRQEGLWASHPHLSDYQLVFQAQNEGQLVQPVERLFTENETNPGIFGAAATGFFKDAFHEFIVQRRQTAVNPEKFGTKAGIHFQLNVAPGASTEIRLRLRSILSQGGKQKEPNPAPFVDFGEIFKTRIQEADEFYDSIQPGARDTDARSVQRQAFAGMIWSKQFYYYDIPEWLDGDPGQPPPPPERKQGRNKDWRHLNTADIISMPDKWEYPWFAAWDWAFHCLPLAVLDPEFAKSQLILLTREWYMHPNGQLPAYEWAFGDVNPPVHAWGAWRVFELDREQRRRANPADPGDLAFLERVYHKLLLNFTWWVNRKDAQGRNIFQGGFLGLDNIGVFDRGAPLPTGGVINQADGTSWMAMYCLNLMRIALELAQHNHVYEDIATKFFEHFLNIAAAMNNMGDKGLGLWSEKDEFYYDVLQLPDGRCSPVELRSLVGLIPLFAVEVIEPELMRKLPEFYARLKWFLNYRPELASLVSRWHEPGLGNRHLLSLLRGHRMKCLLRRMLDETEFLSDYGVRGLSKVYEKQPFELNCDGWHREVTYWPAESRNGLFGGNSNWRGPIWMPANYLLIESLYRFHAYYGDDFKIECPARSGRFITLRDVALELTKRLTRLFLKNPDAGGLRPVLNYHPKLASDPHFRDYVLFHEYFHGDTGRGVGASHQTGWTGLIALLLQAD
ncbi:MAG TPA: glucosidase [Verrucomicrobiae bacterium]|nr:glucosidase [Verrucomicrobiae bacterium]